MEKLKIPYPILVEGKYDKIKLDSVLDANIIVTDGFGVFKNSEKTSLIRKLAEKTPIICAFDSDNAGLVIRNHIKSALPKEKIIHVYFPEIEGKERRKEKFSKQGLLGVEGMEADLIRKLFAPYAVTTASAATPQAATDNSKAATAMPKKESENLADTHNGQATTTTPLASFTEPSPRKITRIDLFDDGLLGGTDSSEKRKRLLKKLDLPTNLSTSALLDVLNVILTYEEYKKLI